MEQLAEIIPNDKKYIMLDLAKEVDKILAGHGSPPESYMGYRFMPGFEPETARYVNEEKKFEENCVIIATFPKSGTTWTTEIVKNILYGDDEENFTICKLITPPVHYLELMKAKKYEATDHIPLPRRFYATHLPVELMNVEKIKKAKGKFIFVERNPKDQGVSLFHFMQISAFQAIREEIPADWSSFFDKYVSGKLPLISKDGEWYSDYLLGWNEYRDDKSFLFLRFEDMKKDCGEVIKRIAKFLDVQLSEDRVKDIVTKTTFEAMKKAENSAEPDVVNSSMKKVKMLREGEVGSWKDVFTVAQSELMDKLIDEKLGKTNIRFVYELE